jgi:hypothetical protein
LAEGLAVFLSIRGREDPLGMPVPKTAEIRTDADHFVKES